MMHTDRAPGALPYLCRLVGLAILVGCAPGSGDADSAAAPGDEVAGGPVHIARERQEDLTGDGRPERLTLVAHGPGTDTLDVRLEIRSPEDSLLYASDWNTHFYFQYDDRGAMSDSAAEAKVRAHLDRVLVDSAFSVGGRPAPGDSIGESMMRDAIRFDIATNEWRRQHSLPVAAPIPGAAHDSINVIARSVPASRIDALARELKPRKSFKYFAGGEVTYVIAWSDAEQRFVVIFSCC